MRATCHLLNSSQSTGTRFLRPSPEIQPTTVAAVGVIAWHTTRRQLGNRSPISNSLRVMKHRGMRPRKHFTSSCVSVPSNWGATISYPSASETKLTCLKLSNKSSHPYRSNALRHSANTADSPSAPKSDSNVSSYLLAAASSRTSRSGAPYSSSSTYMASAGTKSNRGPCAVCIVANQLGCRSNMSDWTSVRASSFLFLR